MSKAECEEAAEELGLSDTEASPEDDMYWPPYWASPEDVSDWPPYCYLAEYGSLAFNYNGFSTLYFNESPEANGNCTSSEICICSSITGKQVFTLHILYLELPSSFCLCYSFAHN